MLYLFCSKLVINIPDDVTDAVIANFELVQHQHSTQSMGFILRDLHQILLLILNEFKRIH